MSDQINPIQVQKFLGGVDYPADRDALCKSAEDHGAPDDVMDLLKQLPDRTYDSPTEVSHEVSGVDRD